MMPRSWAASSASAIWRAIGSASSSGSAPCGDPLGEGRPLDQLEDQHRRPARLLEAVDRPDVRVIERGQHLRLPLKRARRSGSAP